MYLRKRMTGNVTEIVHIIIVIIKQFYSFIIIFYFHDQKFLSDFTHLTYSCSYIRPLLDVLVTEHVFVYKILNMYLVQLTLRSFFRFEIVVAEMTEVSTGWND